MRARLMTILFFVGIFAVAYALRLTIAPGMLPIGDAESPGWRFQLAFVLKAVENIGLIGATIAVLVTAFCLLQRRMVGTIDRSS